MRTLAAFAQVLAAIQAPGQGHFKVTKVTQFLALELGFVRAVDLDKALCFEVGADVAVCGDL